MSKGARSGLSTRLTNEAIARLRLDGVKLRAVRALWLAVQNEPHKTVSDMAFEFYEAVGKILEGCALTSLELRSIDRARAKQHYEET